MARTKEFDTDKAIDQALEVFWENGFERASLSQLTEATGLHKGSLYGAFKSKENLFQLCLDRYMNQTRSDFASSGSAAGEYLENFFNTKITCKADRRKKGCFLMNTSVELANAEDRLDTSKVERMLKSVEENLKTAVVSGIETGEFSKKLDAQVTTERLLALAFTIEEMGRMGKGKAFLKNIANGVLKELNIEL